MCQKEKAITNPKNNHIKEKIAFLRSLVKNTLHIINPNEESNLPEMISFAWWEIEKLTKLIEEERIKWEM